MQDTITATTRYSFTAQFIEAAAAFVRKAAAMEDGYSGTISDEQAAEHRAFISTAVMQCAAALETESHEICTFGPGSHLGSNGTDLQAEARLTPLAEFVERQETLARYQVLLHVLGKPMLDRGGQPFQDASLVVRLRNEITHYKSLWSEELSQQRLFASLQKLSHRPPPFAHLSQNFFPHRCLGAECGAWAVKSTVAFLDEVYRILGVSSRLEPYRARLSVPR